MSANTASSGVRNLRAMFENKHTDQSTSPPSRGRSPNNSITSGNSRPVSKVRTSFVAVERPGDITSGQQWGLRKASDISSMAEVKESEPMPQTSNIETPRQPEQTKSPTSPHTSKQSIDGGLGSILKGSAFDGTPQKRPQEKRSPIKASSSATKKNQSTASPGVGSRAMGVIKKTSKNSLGSPPKTTLSTKADAKPSKDSHSNPMVKPSPTSPRSPRLERSSPKTPTSPTTAKSNVRGGPGKIKGVMDSAKRASEGREGVKKEQPKPMPKKEPEAMAISETKTGPKPVAKKETGIQSKPKVNGVKKEAVPATTKSTSPKAPTKPGRLPSAATATTAAAAAKHDSQTPVQQAVRRPAPRTSLPATKSRATAGTTSSAGHTKSSRASLATNGNDRPRSRVSLNKPDEGFMARMMRPTQSSSQKTHEKVQADSPPRWKGPPKTTHPSKAEGIGKRMRSLRESDHSESQSSKLEDVVEAPAKKNATLKSSQEATHLGAESLPSPSRHHEMSSAGPNGSTPVNGTSTAAAEI